VPERVTMSGQMERCLDFGRECAQLLRSSRRYDHLIPRFTPENAVSEFIESKDRGYLVIVGEPGIGKTGFLMNLCSNAAISYFFQERSWSARILNFLNYLAAELHLRLGEDSALLHWLDDPDEAHIRTNSLLHRVGQNLAQGEKLLIMVDALDEADLGNDENARLLKFDLPRGLYFICTSRPEPRILGQLEGHRDVSSIFNWRKDEPTTAEVNNYITDCLREASNIPVQSKVKTSAHGLILIASHLLRTLERGAISLTEIPTRIQTIDAFFEDDWNNRILKQARTADLCEDVATLFAASQEPLSASIIAGAMWHHETAKSRMRDIKQSLIDIETFLEPIGQGDVHRWRPFHPSFGRWLEEFYREDLCEAHRALAMTFIEILKNPTNPDFGCATRCVCRHLREWAKRTIVGSQKSEMHEILGKLSSDMKLRKEIEHCCGPDVYLEHILHEGINHAEETGSLPDMIRFGVQYISYRREVSTHIDYLEELLKRNRLTEAMQVAVILPREEEVLGCLAIIGCQAADNNNRGVLVEVLDHISANYKDGFESFTAAAWSLMGRLINLGEKELLGRFISVISDEEFNRSTPMLYYLRKTLQIWSNSHLSLDVVSLFLDKVARYKGMNLPYCLAIITEVAFDSGLPDNDVADCLLNSLKSLKDAKARLGVARVLAEIFTEHHLSTHAKQAIELFIEDFAYSDPLDFCVGLGSIRYVLSRLENKSVVVPLSERLLVKIIEGYDQTFDFYKAETLSIVTNCAGELPASKEVRLLEGRVKSAVSHLDHVFFQDYVRVHLIDSLLLHESYAEVAREMDSIKDPLCRVWAEVLVTGYAITESKRLPSTVVQKVMKNLGEHCPLSVHVLLQLGKRILEVATKPVSASGSVETKTQKGDNIGYPHIAVLALGDILYVLNNSGTARERDVKELEGLLQKSLPLLRSTKSKLQWFTTQTLEILLEQAEQIAYREIRQQVFSEILACTSCIGPDWRVNFLQHFAYTVVRVGDRQNLTKLVEMLPQLPKKVFHLGGVMHIFRAAHTAMMPVQTFELINRFVDRIASSESFRRDIDHTELIFALSSLLDTGSTIKVLERLRDIFARDILIAVLSYPLVVAIADCYAQMGLWEEARRYAEDRKCHRAWILSHLGFQLECKMQTAKGREFFIETLKSAKATLGQDTYVSDVHGALAVGFAKTGSFDLALKELRNVRVEPYRAKIPHLAVLNVISSYSEPCEQKLSEFEAERSLIDGVLADLTGLDLLVGLKSKVLFFKRRGCDKQMRQTLEELLASIDQEIKAAKGESDFRLADALLALRVPLIDVAGDQELKNWLDTIVALYDHVKNPYIFYNLVEGMSPCVATEKPWLVSKLIDVLPRYDTKADAEYMRVPCYLAKMISSVDDEELCVKYWQQFLIALSQMSFTHPEHVGKSLSTYLANSAAGTIKAQLLSRLCAALANALPSSPPAFELTETIREIVHTVVENNRIKDKKKTLRQILTVLPLSSGNPWLLALIAEGMALLGDQREASSLFAKAIELSDEVSGDFIREAEKSRILLIMSESGFTNEALPLLRNFRTKGSPYAEEVNKNLALGLLYCNDLNRAMSIAGEETSEKALSEIAARLFTQNAREFDSLARTEQSMQTSADNNEQLEAKHILLRNMEKYLRIVDKVHHTSTRCDGLTEIASEILNLPNREAIKWFAKLPSFPNDDKIWNTFCATYDYDPEIVRKLLITRPQTDSKNRFLTHLSGLGNKVIPERLRLFLCTQAVRNEYYFFRVACNCLKNCEDVEVLEEVKHELDEIEGIKTKGVVEEVSEAPEATVVKAEDEELELTKEGEPKLKPSTPTSISRKKESKQIEVEFTSTGVKINEEPEKPFTVEWLMLEYSLWKNDRVHWTEGYLIFPGWRSLPDGATNGRNQFRQKTTKCKQAAEKCGLKIEFTKTKDENTVWWELVTYNISTNITKAKSHYKEAKELFDDDKWGDARKKLLKALKAYPNHLQSHLLLVRCYEKQGPKKLSAAQLRELLSSWHYLDGKCTAINDIRRICSKKKEDKELQAFLSSLLNGPLYSQLEGLTDVLFGWIMKGELSEDEILIMEVNKLLREIRTAKKTTQQEEKIKAFCRIPCVAEILTSDTKLAEVSGLLFFSSAEDDVVAPRFQAIVRRTYKSKKELQKSLRNTLVYLRKDLQRQERLQQLGGSKKIANDVKRLDEFKEELCQKLHRERITDEELIQAVEAVYRWDREYVKRLLKLKATKHYRELREDDSIKRTF